MNIKKSCKVNLINIIFNILNYKLSNKIYNRLSNIITINIITRKIITLSILVVTLNSCASDYFSLYLFHPDKTKRITGRIFTEKSNIKNLNVYNVNIFNDNSIELKDKNTIALKYLIENEYIADFTFEAKSGKSVNFYTRSAYDDFGKQNKIRLEFNNNGVYLYEKYNDSEKLIGKDLSKKLTINEKTRFFIKNDGKKLKISMDCDDIFDVRTNLNISQYLIIETEADSEIVLSAINFENIR